MGSTCDRAVPATVVRGGHTPGPARANLPVRCGASHHLPSSGYLLAARYTASVSWGRLGRSLPPSTGPCALVAGSRSGPSGDFCRVVRRPVVLRADRVDAGRRPLCERSPRPRARSRRRRPPSRWSNDGRATRSPVEARAEPRPQTACQAACHPHSRLGGRPGSRPRQERKILSGMGFLVFRRGRRSVGGTMRGRDREWRHVEGLLRRLRRGGSGTLLVDGEPASGKSRLLTEAVARRPDAGSGAYLGGRSGRPASSSSSRGTTPSTTPARCAGSSLARSRPGSVGPNKVLEAASGTLRCGDCHQTLPWITDAGDVASAIREGAIAVRPLHERSSMTGHRWQGR